VAAAMVGVAAGTVGIAGPASAADGPISCTYTVDASWSGGFFADLAIANAGPAVNGWTVRWTFADPTSGIHGWNAQITLQDNVVTATNLSWNGTINTGQVVAFGWSATAAKTTVPTDITVNGTPC
jgi:cellulase/cellobiase CelA1